MFFEQNPTRVVVVYALLTDPSTHTILTVLNENGSWTLPGGKRVPNESLTQASIRETQEEIGLDNLRFDHIRLLHLFKSNMSPKKNT